MADKYCNFEELASNEEAGVAYRILVRRATRPFAIVAPHGGGIEPGTSEIADAIAGDDVAARMHSFYAFEGLKPRHNTDLHITSTHFDEPMCLVVVGASERVVTIHGEESTEDGEGVFLGGLDEVTGAGVREKLEAAGFNVRRHPRRDLQGLDVENICNRGTSGVGVQLELSHAVRETFFESLTRKGRQHPTARFGDFVEAMRRALE